MAILLRQCDNNTLIVGRQRIVVPNAYVVDVFPAIHQQLLASNPPVAPALANEVRRHAAEQGYIFVGPVAVDLHPALSDMTVGFRIHSRVSPAGGCPSA
ncbi:FhaA domain-containing protein [Streptomyces doebereineriae]|uniref:DUF3662 domain-containing protein n=1 Tax=Streptomyces doebereineriae TaxID=3075528 RepID=A0ABU2V0P3_9ACTN|nr:FhaA domain-containing protein [Streptomyces sp. DSM 41640]MDT0478809.1 DUF3662 domain-containing protein [Streptomyces sp. DSM 41640]